MIKNSKPEPPWDGFPLFAHRNGQWAKKIRGRFHYFGVWADPDAAYRLYREQKDDLFSGRKPTQVNGLTVNELLCHFLFSKEQKRDAGEMSLRSWEDYKRACLTAHEVLGRNTVVESLRPPHFAPLRAKLAETMRGNTLKNWIIRIRSMFKFAWEERLIREPVAFGQSFSVPSLKSLRAIRNEKGPRMFEPAQLRTVIDEAYLQLRAFVLLGINCGFGITDCGTLPFRALDLDGGWVSYPRPKTGIQRRCPLWPETVACLREVIANRAKPKKGSKDTVILTRFGTSYIGATSTRKNPASQRLRELLKKLGFHRPGLNHSCLRHHLQTIGEETGEAIAVQVIMGHAPAGGDMSAVYRELVFKPAFDARLRKVTNHVWQWLYAY